MNDGDLHCLSDSGTVPRTRVAAAFQENDAARFSPCADSSSLAAALSSAVAAVAGLLLAPITFVHANMGLIGLKAFPAAVVGGFTSLPGAILGGVIIGVVEALAGFYLPEGFKDVAAYVVVLAVLLVRPSGIFGETARRSQQRQQGRKSA